MLTDFLYNSGITDKIPTVLQVSSLKELGIESCRYVLGDNHNCGNALRTMFLSVCESIFVV